MVIGKKDLGSRRSAALSSLIGNAGNMGVAAMQAVVLIPIYLARLGSRLYGAWAASGDIFIWMQALDFGIPNLMIQRIGAAHAQGDEKKVGEWLASGLIVMGAIAILIGLGGVIIAQILPAWLRLHGGEAGQLRISFILGSIAIAIILLNYCVIGYAQGVQDTKFVSIISVVSSVIGFLLTFCLIITGLKLYSIAIGLIGKALLQTGGNAYYLAKKVHWPRGAALRISRPILREMGLITPVTGLGGLSYALMSQSELIIIAVMTKPELAAIYVVTRKAADFGRAIIDMIGFASYGGFAHLVASNDHGRSLAVYKEIRALRTSVAIAIGAAFIAVNPSLLKVWVKTSNNNTKALTLLIGLQTIIVGASYLTNYLYRATGAILKGSVALIIEASIRLPLIIFLLKYIGLTGVPIASILTAITFTVLANRWALSRISAFSDPVPTNGLRIWLIRLSILLFSMALCVWIGCRNWWYVISVGTAIFGISLFIQIMVDRHLKNLRRMFSRSPLAFRFEEIKNL